MLRLHHGQRDSFHFVRWTLTASQVRRCPSPLPSNPSPFDRRGDALESHVHPPEDFQRTQPDQERSQSEGPLRPFGVTEQESSCRRVAARQQVNESRSISNECSTLAHRGVPDKEGVVQFWNSNSERPHPEENCALVREIER